MEVMNPIDAAIMNGKRSVTPSWIEVNESITLVGPLNNRSVDAAARNNDATMNAGTTQTKPSRKARIDPLPGSVTSRDLPAANAFAICSLTPRIAMDQDNRKTLSMRTMFN